MNKSTKTAVKVLFWGYIIIMLWLLFGQRMPYLTLHDYKEQLRSNLNLVPFFTIRHYLRLIEMSPNFALIRHAFINLLGNIVMFIPLGLLLPAVWKASRKTLIFIPAVVGSVCLVEAVQLFTLLGSCDVDDLIFNVIGALLGFILFKIAYTLYSKHKKDTAG